MKKNIKKTKIMIVIKVSRLDAVIHAKGKINKHGIFGLFYKLPMGPLQEVKRRIETGKGAFNGMSNNK